MRETAMLQLPLLLADFGNIEKYVIQGLAVAGGGLVGFFGTGGLVKVLGLSTGAQKQRPTLKYYTKLLGGGTAAFLVYLLLSGDGGLGLGGKGSGDSADSDKEGKPQPLNREPVKSPNQIDNDAENIEIFVIAGDPNEKKFYRVGREGAPVSIDELGKQLDERKRAGTKPLKLVTVSADDLEYPAQAETLLYKELKTRDIKHARIGSMKK